MFERFVKEGGAVAWRAEAAARSLLERRGFVDQGLRVAWRAEAAAGSLGSSIMEAEHVLLALAGGDDAAGRALAGVGFDEDATRAAIDRDFESVLAGVGVGTEAIALAAGCRSNPRRPPWAPSATAAFERAIDAARDRGDRRVGSEHVLIGLLGAKRGAVPRILDREGVEPAELMAGLPTRGGSHA